jgi:hypothetical protein
MPDRGNAIRVRRLSRQPRKAGNLTKDQFDCIDPKAEKILEAEREN